MNNPNDNLALYLPLDAVTNGQVADASGYRNNGVLQGDPVPTMVADKTFTSQHCLSLDGAHSYVEVDVVHHPELQISGDLTLEAWVYIDSDVSATDWVRIIGQDSSNALYRTKK